VTYPESITLGVSQQSRSLVIFRYLRWRHHDDLLAVAGVWLILADATSELKGCSAAKVQLSPHVRSHMFAVTSRMCGELRSLIANYLLLTSDKISNTGKLRA